jgi:transposase-like protein
MEKNNIIDYKNPSQNLVTDVLSDFLRSSAQKMLQLAIEEEVQNFITSYQDKLLTNGNKQIVRNGYLPERTIQTGIGEMAVKVPRVRDRGEENIKFTSNLIPQYMRRTVTIDVLLPLL